MAKAPDGLSKFFWHFGLDLRLLWLIVFCLFCWSTASDLIDIKVEFHTACGTNRAIVIAVSW